MAMVPIQPGTPLTTQAPATFPQTWTNPDANMALYEAANRQAYANVLTNPYFIQALATIGGALDPEGVPGALGTATKGMVSSRQAAKANATSIADANKRHKELIDTLNRVGGMTPKGQPGPSSIAMGPDGGMTIKIDSTNPIKPAPPPAAPNRDTQSSTPTAPVREQVIYDGPDPGAVSGEGVAISPATPITPQGAPTGPPTGAAYGSMRTNAPVYRPSDAIPFYQAPLRSAPRR